MRPKMILIAVVAVFVVGAGLYLNSGSFNRQLAVVKGFSRECIDGVQYLQFVSGATVKYNTDGTIATCK